MAKSKSSRRWLAEHFDDQYVKMAQQQGLRARAAFKLMELDEKYCDVIIKRWQDFTGQEAINQDGKKYNEL